MKKNATSQIFSIGEAAQKLEIATPTLRMYEKGALIIPERAPNGRRVYTPTDLERVRAIRHLIKTERLNTEGIRRLIALIPCWDINKCPLHLVRKCPAYHQGRSICWTLPATANLLRNHKCKACAVYTDCFQTIEILKEFLKKQGN
ncbi:MerR family transcriptional regulator [candidate division KSB1 bacterium]|nr:MerR family transcriptional regulator [candidate division KSB1 bacterium]